MNRWFYPHQFQLSKPTMDWVVVIKDTKTIRKEVSGARNRQKTLGLFFAALNANC